jgi:hypothetical protein
MALPHTKRDYPAKELYLNDRIRIVLLIPKAV